VRLEVALTPANLQAGKDIGLKLKEMCTLSLTESLAYDMDNVSALLRELPSVLTKLKSGKFDDSEDVAKDLQDSLVKMEAWVQNTLAPDYMSEIDHIRSFATGNHTPEAEWTVSSLCDKQLSDCLCCKPFLLWGTAVNVCSAYTCFIHII
jgi:hypothetical protein